MNGYLDSMRRYFAFSGRSSPSEYWSFARVLFGIALIIAIVDEFLLKTGGATVVIQLIALVHLVPAAALTARRLHDAGRSGWAAIIVFVPIINIIAWIIVGRLKPTPGENRFGLPVGADAAPSPMAAPTAREGASPASVVERLEKLAALRASGAIDDAEFQRLKADLMKEGDR